MFNLDEKQLAFTNNINKKNDSDFFNSLKKMTNEILIVDDNPFNVYSLQLLISEFFNLECDCAYSGQEAIDMLKDRLRKKLEPYKLVLTDINMP